MLQKEADESKRDTVVLLLQDMLEVITRDMMVNEIRSVKHHCPCHWMIEIRTFLHEQVVSKF